MAEHWVRPTRTTGAYGVADGSDFDNAWQLSDWNDNWNVYSYNTGDTIYFCGVGENGQPAPFVGMNPGVKTDKQGVIISGRPPGYAKAVFSEPDPTQFQTNDPMVLVSAITAAWEGDGTVIEDIVFSGPSAVTDGMCALLLAVDNVTFRRCDFIGNGLTARSISAGGGIIGYQTNNGNKGGSGGIGLLTVEDCTFTDFGNYAIQITWSGTAVTHRKPLRLIVRDTTFTRCVRPIFVKTSENAIFDAYFASSTVDNGLVNQLVVDGCLFDECEDWAIDHTWMSAADSGFDSGITNCIFRNYGAFYTGESYNIIQTHGNKGGSISGNRFEGWHQGDDYDACAIIIDHYDATGGTLYGCDGVTVGNNIILDGRAHEDMLVANGYASHSAQPNVTRAKGIGLWNGANCRFIRNTIQNCGIGVRVAPDNRNSGNVFIGNTFNNNADDWQHNTGGATASSTFASKYDRYLGGVWSFGAEGNRVYVETGTPAPTAPTWVHPIMDSGTDEFEAVLTKRTLRLTAGGFGS